MTAPLIDLTNISHEALLKARIRELPLSIEGTWLADCVNELYAELKSRGLVFFPECYLADEWLTAEGEVAIGVPFYLAHPVLIKLERHMMLEAEGEGKSWCMQLLRHEAGHAFSYAYNLHKKRSWQKVFGSPRKEYGHTYKFKPYSKSYVRHLDGFYAQYHPDEDFVETFAVWLTPQENWQQKYRGWKALDKLQFVDRLMQTIKGQAPLKIKGRKLWHYKRLTMTLEKYYKKKRFYEQEEFPDFHDEHLKKIFTPLVDAEWLVFKKERFKNKEIPMAQDFIRAHAKNIIHSIDRSTGERQYIISRLLKAIHSRVKQLHMVVLQPQALALIQLSVYVTSLTMNYAHTGLFRGTRVKL